MVYGICGVKMVVCSVRWGIMIRVYFICKEYELRVLNIIFDCLFFNNYSKLIFWLYFIINLIIFEIMNVVMVNC